MVSKASDDFPEPDRPVITTSRSLGRIRSMFLRLCWRAPRISILSRGIVHPELGYRTSNMRSKAVRPVISMSYRGISFRRFERCRERDCLHDGCGRNLQTVQTRAIGPHDLALCGIRQAVERQKRVD